MKKKKEVQIASVRVTKTLKEKIEERLIAENKAYSEWIVSLIEKELKKKPQIKS